MIGLNHQPLPDASREDDIKFNLAYSIWPLKIKLITDEIAMIGTSHQPLPDASREDDILINLA